MSLTGVGGGQAFSLTVIQKAACEAVWRALQERDHDRTGTLITRDLPEPVAKARIASFVTALPLAHLPKLVLPELETYGPLKGGFTERWANVSEAQARWLAHTQAEGSRRVSDNVPWTDTSTPGTSDAAEPSEPGEGDRTPLASPPVD